uniref:NME/NM23 family member 8 n=1 Tax=Gopherus evgoodei TaxID=1825980 RepID=A0A8C4W5W8_9SAUR
QKKKRPEIDLEIHVCQLIDVYQAWCGPCKAVVNLFRKLKNEHGEDDLLHFAVAEADSIVTLQTFRDKCEPVFLFCVDGKIIAIVRGTNAPLLSKTIIKLLEEERKILAGEIERPQHHFNVLFVDSILKRIKDDGFTIAMQKEIVLTEEQAHQFYKEHENEDFFPTLLEHMTRGPSVIMILTKENAVEEWRQLMGPTDPDVAKESSPDSLRAQFAQDILRNAVHGSSNKEHALKSIEYESGQPPEEDPGVFLAGAALGLCRCTDLSHVGGWTRPDLHLQPGPHLPPSGLAETPLQCK